MPNKLVFLKTEQDFASFKKSKSLFSANFQFRWHVSKNQNTPRFGFIVPKKTIPKVTDRNKVKRRIKAILLKMVADLGPVDILFFPKPGTIKLKVGEMESEISSFFKKSGLL